MSQGIIAAIIIILAFAYAVYSIVKSFRKKNDPCSGCGSDCGSCAVADLKKNLAKKNN